jgi:hypothetical protein
MGLNFEGLSVFSGSFLEVREFWRFLSEGLLIKGESANPDPKPSPYGTGTNGMNESGSTFLQQHRI